MIFFHFVPHLSPPGERRGGKVSSGELSLYSLEPSHHTARDPAPTLVVRRLDLRQKYSPENPTGNREIDMFVRLGVVGKEIYYFSVEVAPLSRLQNIDNSSEQPPICSAILPLPLTPHRSPVSDGF